MDFDMQAEEKTCIKEYLSMWSKMVTLLSGLEGVKKQPALGRNLDMHRLAPALLPL